MSDDPDLWANITKSTLANLALWGGIGGATNALVTRAEVREALRLTALGALVAAGMGSLTAGVISHYTGLPSEVILAGGLLTSSAYVAGVFGAAIIEVLLARIRAGRLPGERGGHGE